MKKANGEGSEYFDETNKCFVVIKPYIDPTTGKRKDMKRTSRKSRIEARKKADSAIAKILSAKPTQQTPTSSYTVETWLRYWLERFKKKDLKQKTYERYESHLICNIIPYIGNVPLSKLTTLGLSEFLSDLQTSGGKLAEGIAPRSVNAVRNLLKSALSDAVDYNIILTNPALKTKPAKTKPPEMHTLSEDQCNKLMSTALSKNMYSWIIIVLGITTGMRIGEIFGLKWSDIDFDNKRLFVQRTVVTVRHGNLLQDSTKTIRSTRHISLPKSTIDALHKFKQWQQEQALFYGPEYAKSEWIISNPNGKPRSPNSFSSHEFKDTLVAASIDRSVRFHDLRHTHATLLLLNDQNVKLVSQRLGHSSVKTTLEIYAHVLEEMDSKAIAVLDEIF